MGRQWVYGNSLEECRAQGALNYHVSFFTFFFFFFFHLKIVNGLEWVTNVIDYWMARVSLPPPFHKIK